MKKDNRLIAILSVFGILLVVLGHSGFEEEIIKQTYAGLHRWIYSFHMPLFFLISGYLFAYTTSDFSKLDVGRLLKKKVRRLLFPYFVFGSILFVIKMLFSQFSYVDRDFSIVSYCTMFFVPQASYSTMGYLWFLPALFLIFLVVGLLCLLRINLRKNSQVAVVVIISFTLNILFPHIQYLLLSEIFWYLPFFVGGIWYQQNQEILERRLCLGSIGVCLLLGGLSIGEAVYFPSGIFIIKVVYVIVGILFSISLCINVMKFCGNSKIPLANYTYSIYLLSWFGQYGTKIFLMELLHVNVGVYLLPLLFVVGVTFPVLCCMLLENVKSNSLIMKYTRLLIGI